MSKRLKLFFGFAALLSMFLLSCRNENNEPIEPLMENYTLKEQNLTSLSPFSINFNIKQINIDKKNNRHYLISSIRAYGKHGDSETIENTNIYIEDSSIMFSTPMFSKLYSIKKDILKNTLYFNNGITNIKITNTFLDNVSGDDAYVLKRLISLYIELYDTSIKKMGNETSLLAKKKACAQFESGIGFTSSAAAYRAQYDAKEFISEGHGDCKIIGTDVSCIFDGHICFATTTMACNGNTCH